MNETVTLSNLSNEEFLAKYARPGRVGLSGGITLIDRAIQMAERHVDEKGSWGKWSHVFLFQGQRADGHHWVIESDLQVIRKHVSLGVQENRISKYHDDSYYTWLAVLDFGLEEEQVSALLREGLDLVAGRTRYSLRELAGALFALRHPQFRGRGNVLSRDKSLYCSAMVQYLFRKIGVDLAPNLHEKNSTPEDISRSPVPHVTYVLERKVEPGRIAKMAGNLRRRIRARIGKDPRG